MWEEFVEIDRFRRDPIRSFVHRYAIRLGYRPPDQGMHLQYVNL